MNECVPSGTGITLLYTRMGEREGRGDLNMLEAAKELGVERRVISELVRFRLPAHGGNISSRKNEIDRPETFSRKGKVS